MAEGGSLPSGDTSRVNRQVYARFCERLRVKFPGPTRRRRPHSISSPYGAPNCSAAPDRPREYNAR
jgi:hypothetical protein